MYTREWSAVAEICSSSALLAGVDMLARSPLGIWATTADWARARSPPSAHRHSPSSIARDARGSVASRRPHRRSRSAAAAGSESPELDSSPTAAGSGPSAPWCACAARPPSAQRGPAASQPRRHRRAQMPTDAVGDCQSTHSESTVLMLGALELGRLPSRIPPLPSRASSAAPGARAVHARPIRPAKERLLRRDQVLPAGGARSPGAAAARRPLMDARTHQPAATWQARTGSRRPQASPRPLPRSGGRTAAAVIYRVSIATVHLAHGRRHIALHAQRDHARGRCEPP